MIFRPGAGASYSSGGFLWRTTSDWLRCSWLRTDRGAAGRAAPPVPVVVAHGLFAVVTVVLVLLAALGVAVS